MSGHIHLGGGGVYLIGNDQDESHSLSWEEVEFRQNLDSTILDIYPVLVERVRSAKFAGWQRSVHVEEDIAQQACAEFYAQCVRKGMFPDASDLLAYVVQIAKNIAGRQYAAHKRAQEYVVDPEDPALGKLFAADIDATEELSGFDKWLQEMGREERLLNALPTLPRRQRESFELWIGNSSLTYAELGKRMNISGDGFRKNFDRACEALEAVLKPTLTNKADCPPTDT